MTLLMETPNILFKLKHAERRRVICIGFRFLFTSWKYTPKKLIEIWDFHYCRDSCLCYDIVHPLLWKPTFRRNMLQSWVISLIWKFYLI